MLELSDKGFKVAMMKILQQIIMNTVETNKSLSLYFEQDWLV